MDTANLNLRVKPQAENRRHDLIQCVIDHACHALQKHGVEAIPAAQIATAVADQIVDAFSGQVINFPAEYARKSRERDAQVYAEFNGENYAELATRYCMHERSVRRVIDRHRNRIKQAQAGSSAA
ncbi:UNVERIFIED_ORG: Mor family transcriptional regulator [Comamonas terrigena]